MQRIVDVLTFRTMVSTYVLQALFWAGVGGCVYGAWVLLARGHWAWWMSLVFGPLVTRVIFERALVAFRTYDRLVELARRLEERTGG